MPLSRIQLLKSGAPLHGSFRIGLFLLLLCAINTLTVLLTDPTNNIILAATLLLRGSIQIAFGHKHRTLSYSTSWLTNLSATFYLTAGAALIDEPDGGSPLLTFILLTCLAFAGLARMFWACTHRYVRNWGVIVGSGCFTSLTGVLLYLSLPWPTSWLLGVLLALELLVAGTASLILAFTTRFVD
ncbi:HdeD family acid-resistance protein [Neokomagataea anthophila]|uniref:HdeD family acid-resistance protein n=1 Tax=Neokomagataea anthophila TaxID=2826925 RepID=A0ABS5E8X1_9PROT|nr:HdeD family acid-resistance protein [Neokomagataea anthophila]MBR0560357.1 HdeD family acid-resistance protein [Neokomagataea anthophila]